MWLGEPAEVSHPRCSDPWPSCYRHPTDQRHCTSARFSRNMQKEYHAQVVWSEKGAEGTRPDRVHGSGLQVDQNGTGHVLASGGLIVVNVDTLELEIRGALVRTVGLDAVLLGHDLPRWSAKARRHGMGWQKPVLTRTWHRSGYHTDQSEDGRFHALIGRTCRRENQECEGEQRGVKMSDEEMYNRDDGVVMAGGGHAAAFHTVARRSERHQWHRSTWGCDESRGEWEWKG